MTGYVVTCSGQWEYMTFNNAQVLPICNGTLQSVSSQELNPSGLSGEDLSEYIGHVMILFAVVFGFLAVKKAIF